MILFQLNVSYALNTKWSDSGVINNTLFHLALAPLSIELSVYKREIFYAFIYNYSLTRPGDMQVVQLSDVGITKKHSSQS